MRDVSLTVLELDGPVPFSTWGCALSAEHSESMSESMSDRKTLREIRFFPDCAGIFRFTVLCVCVCVEVSCSQI